MAKAITASVLRAEKISPTVRLIEFGFADEDFEWEAGGHLNIDVTIDGNRETRSYSLVCKTERGVQIAVRLAEQSRGGSRFMWSLEPGDQVTVYRTRNGFPLSFGAENYKLIAGGIGITPLIGMARLLVELDKDVEFFYCIRNHQDAPFTDELRDLLGDRLSVFCSDDNTFLPIEEVVDSATPRTLLYMCGPLGFMEAVKSSWYDQGLPRHNLRFETFGSSGQLPPVDFDVVVAETGARVTVKNDVTLLEALLRANQPVMYECMKGECGLCKVQVEGLDGTIDHRDVFLSDQEKADNKTLCCCVSRIDGKEVKIRLDHIQHGKYEGDKHKSRTVISPVMTF